MKQNTLKSLFVAYIVCSLFGCMQPSKDQNDIKPDSLRLETSLISLFASDLSEQSRHFENELASARDHTLVTDSIRQKVEGEYSKQVLEMRALREYIEEREADLSTREKAVRNLFIIDPDERNPKK